MVKSSWLAALPLGFAASVAMADGSIADMFSYNGFGTAGIVRTDTNQVEYIRTGQPVGATEGLYWKTDSDFGLQGTVAPTDWLSGTIQVLAVDRFNNSVSPKIEWAFVKLRPLAALSIRAGEMALPAFLISDSRYIGYANPWIRPPDEVYGIAALDTFHGADIVYQYKLGGYLMTIGGLAGKSSINVIPFQNVTTILDGRNLRGYNATVDTGVVTLRASYIKTDLDVIFGPYIVDNPIYTFTGFGATSDHNSVLLQAEFIKRHAGRTAYNYNGWYVLGGYHVGKWLPYAIYAANQQPSGPSNPPSPPMELSSLSRHTMSAGVRLDLIQSVDVKLQVDHVTTFPDGVPFANVQPGFNGKLNVFSLAVDFVF